MKRKAIDYDTSDSEDINDDDDNIPPIQHKKVIKLNEPKDTNIMTNTFVPTNTSSFESAVLKRLKDAINSKNRNKNKKFIEDQIYKGINQLFLSLSF